MASFTATCSPEDNKIRLYASSRLDAETYDLRSTVVGWTSGVEAVADSYDLCFYWDFVPDWIVDHIDWSDPARPTIKPERDPQDPDRAATGAAVAAQPPAWRQSADEGN